MNILLVITPRGEDDFALLASPVGPESIPLAFHMADRAAQLADAVHVCTDDPRVLEFFASHGRQALLVPKAAGHNQENAPPTELAEALRFLTSTGRLGASDVVVVADWRAPLLSAQSLRRAESNALAADNGLAASMEPVRDHPAQGDVPYVFLGLGAWAFPETSPQPELPPGCRATRPLFLDWRGEGVADAAPGLCAVARLGLDGRMELCSVTAREAAHLATRRVNQRAAQELVYLWAGQDSARRLLPAMETGRAKGTAAQAYPGQGLPLRFSRTRGGGIVCRARRGAFPPGTELQLWPLRGPDREPMRGPVSLVSLDSLPDAPRGPAALLDAEAFGPETDGVYALAVTLAQGGTGRYDLGLPLTPADGSWRVDPVTNVRINARSGQRITGRQQLPPLLRLDGILMAGRLDRMLEAASWAGPMAEIPLDEQERLKVRNAIDVLRVSLAVGRK